MNIAFILDESLKDQLVLLGGTIIEETKTVNGKTIWRMNFPDDLSFNFSAKKYRDKIIPCDKLVLRF